MNILDDIATWLSTAAPSTGYDQVGPCVSYTVYKLKQPPTTGNMYIIYQYGGLPPEPVRDGTIDNPRLNVRTVSSATSDGGYQAALTIQNRLRYVANRWLPTSTGNLYLSIVPLQSPESLGVDANGRHQWVQNFQVSVTYTA